MNIIPARHGIFMYPMSFVLPQKKMKSLTPNVEHGCIDFLKHSWIRIKSELYILQEKSWIWPDFPADLVEMFSMFNDPLVFFNQRWWFQFIPNIQSLAFLLWMWELFAFIFIHENFLWIQANKKASQIPAFFASSSTVCHQITRSSCLTNQPSNEIFSMKTSKKLLTAEATNGSIMSVMFGAFRSSIETNRTDFFGIHGVVSQRLPDNKWLF